MKNTKRSQKEGVEEKVKEIKRERVKILLILILIKINKVKWIKKLII